MTAPTAPTGRRTLIVEADGGSRGNPGPAAFGALVRDPASHAVLAEAADAIGTATNNVAEYRGLIAGLQLAREVDPEASVDVRMDSKLVIEQMAGRWKIKHADMRQLAMEARRLMPAHVTWTHVPRERNSAADALLNRVLDGGEPIWTVLGGDAAATTAVAPPDHGGQPTAVPQPAPGDRSSVPETGWGETSSPPTTLILVRHGETSRSLAKRFSGSGGEDVPLTDRGRQQAEGVAAALVGRGVDALVTSPLRRTRETAGVIAGALGISATVEDGLAETAFGEWDGLTFSEVRARWPAALQDWLASTTVAPPGGESFDSVHLRVRAALDRLVSSYAGRTIAVVTHVTPIKLLVCLALDVPLRAVFRMELPPGSRSEVRWYADGMASLRSYGVVDSVPS
ncbi:bifunctional RNase H/acid phosphatase [Actinopolymorpha sp. B11F2]|uniref:bifunctional RNase H/acid phosphatase n=1 Tax=Actinopolymorpha sp. B11F2 TaxID=3160862 RepID=UPI0032E47979